MSRSRIFILGHNCSSKFKNALELRSQETVSFSEEIISAEKYANIFSRQMETIVYRCFEKGCPTKPYATIQNSIMGNCGSWSLIKGLGVSAT